MRNLFLSTRYVKDAKANEDVEEYADQHHSEQTDPISGLSTNSFHFTLGSLRRASRKNGFGEIKILETSICPTQQVKIWTIARSFGETSK